MNRNIISAIEAFVRTKTRKHDPAHDFQHIERVVKNAKYIQKYEGGDLEIIVPAAYMHDLVIYRKDDERNAFATRESAQMAAKFLRAQNGYPVEKVRKVFIAIEQCSFSKGVTPDTIEGKILRDADMLEATGAISIMRTFATTGEMRRPFYNPEDPFAERREPVPFEYALDLFPKRLLIVKEHMFTITGKRLAIERTEFLDQFLAQLGKEIYAI